MANSFDCSSDDEFTGDIKCNPINNLNFQCDSNGITHDDYNNLCNSQKQTLGQCQFCLKYYNKSVPNTLNTSNTSNTSNISNISNSMLTTEYDQNGETVCFHCVYMIHYNPVDARINFDGAFGKTITEYIIECKDTHNHTQCMHSEECFICDYLNGIKIEGILGGDDLFANNSIDDHTENKDNDDYSFSITI